MILLSTLNARYSHASLGLRYLYANMQALQPHTTIIERTIHDEPLRLVEELLAYSPKIVGFGVYIWNVEQIGEVITLLKQVAPDVMTVVGGPEVSHSPISMSLEHVDYVLQGEADTAFYKLCTALLDEKAPTQQIIKADMPNLDALTLPYDYYNDEDIAQRTLYIESSRGCPFLCEFCLSSLDQKIRRFDEDAFYAALESLWQRGARTFKFVDRTFNVQISHALKLLDFFLQKTPPFHLHFEVIPDQFPWALREKLTLFAPNTLQLEVGIQTLDKVTSSLISRPLHLEKMQDNLAFLSTLPTHLHLDLIIGLPGETIQMIARHLNALVQYEQAEIQIGILKRLSGTAIVRHTQPFELLFCTRAPYEVLSTSTISFAQMMQLKRFARYWDMYYNSGQFTKTVRLLLNDAAFTNFFDFSNWLYEQIQRTHKISLHNQTYYLVRFLMAYHQEEETRIKAALLLDCSGDVKRVERVFSQINDITITNNKTITAHLKRQKRKLA